MLHLERAVIVLTQRRRGPEVVALLHDASRRGNLSMLELLLGTVLVDDEDAVNTPGRQGLTPLHFACRSGRLEVAQLLVRAGADPTGTNDAGKTPLDAAVANDKQDVVAFLRSLSSSEA